LFFVESEYAHDYRVAEGAGIEEPLQRQEQGFTFITH